MKNILTAFIGILLLTTTYGEDRPTIESLVGEEIRIESDWTGYAFTLKKAEKGYKVVWKTFGSGIPVVGTEELDVQVNSNYQFVFELIRGAKVNEIKLSLADKGEFKVYSDGIRIFAEKESGVE